MDFRDLYKQTEKVGMEEFSKIVSSKGIKSLNESGDPKVMVTAKENDSVTFLVGDKKYVYKGLSPSLIARFEGRLKNKAGFKALNWLKAQTAKEQRFEVKDGKEVSTNESSSFPTNFTKILKTSSGKIKHPADKGYEEVKQDDRGSKAVHYRCTTCNKPHNEKESAAKCCRNYESKINERDSLEAWRETIEEESKKIGIKSHSKMDVDNCLKFIAKHYGAIQANKAIDDFKLESKGYKKLKEFKENDGTPEPQKSVTFTPEKLKELKKIYASTIKDGKSQFTFEGQELLVSYAKYLIQHLENVFGTGKNECKVNESADDMSDEELMSWYKEEMEKGVEPRLINSLKLKLKARGLKVDESKKVNEEVVKVNERVVPLTEIKQVKEGFIVVESGTANKVVSGNCTTLRESKLTQKLIKLINISEENTNFNTPNIKENLSEPFKAFPNGDKYTVYDEFVNPKKSFYSQKMADSYAFELMTPIADKIFRRFLIDCVSSKCNFRDLNALRSYISREFPQYDGGTGLVAVINGMIKNEDSMKNESKVNEDDMMNGGATTASDSSNVVANPNPPTVDNDVNKEENDQEMILCSLPVDSRVTVESSIVGDSQHRQR